MVINFFYIKINGYNEIASRYFKKFKVNFIILNILNINFLFFWCKIRIIFIPKALSLTLPTF